MSFNLYYFDFIELSKLHHSEILYVLPTVCLNFGIQPCRYKLRSCLQLIYLRVAISFFMCLKKKVKEMGFLGE